MKQSVTILNHYIPEAPKQVLRLLKALIPCKSQYYKIFENYWITIKIGIQTLIDPLYKPCIFQVSQTSSFCVVIIKSFRSIRSMEDLH